MSGGRWGGGGREGGCGDGEGRRKGGREGVGMMREGGREGGRVWDCIPHTCAVASAPQVCPL